MTVDSGPAALDGHGEACSAVAADSARVETLQCIILNLQKLIYCSQIEIGKA